MSLQIQQKVSLKERNSFKLASTAEYFCQCFTNTEILEALAFARQRKLDVFTLGGGSNIVLGPLIPGLTLAIGTRGITQMASQMQFSAGENWHECVEASLQASLFGLENLSLIPGTVGAAPIQNIGAYGVELAERFISLQALEKQTGKEVTFSKVDCQFAYRDSIFKREFDGHYVILSVTLELDTVFKPQLSYQGLSTYLEANGLETTAVNISQAVSQIRKSKLPDYNVEGNAGSFFKNPIVSADHFKKLKAKLPILAGHLEMDGRIKLSAGQMIDLLGLKGEVIGGAAIAEKHALVLVNRGEASYEDILMLAKSIQDRIIEVFDLQLEIEPRMFA